MVLHQLDNAESYALPKSVLNLRGCDRRYCFGALTCAPNSAAACQGHRGSQRIARASATISASRVATIASACSKPVIMPTATTGIRTAALTARARGT